MASAHEAARGHEALGDGVRRSLHHPAPGAASFATHADAGHAAGPPRSGRRWTGFVHVAPAENDEAGLWEVGLLVAPDAAGAPDAPDAAGDHDRGATAASLLRAAASHAAANGARTVVVWIPGSTTDDDAATTAAGFVARSELVQLRLGIPPSERPVWPGGTTVRAYRPGSDDAAWLEVNNRAFAGHPEQGSWTATTLEHRRREPWFDPEGFLLAEDARGLAGFCWTKVHPVTAHDPQLGEIYVVGVDPSRQGTGLGRALVLAGLHSLAGRGPRTGMLYVDAANRPAMGLYRALGFREHRVDRAYERSVGCGGEPR